MDNNWSQIKQNLCGCKYNWYDIVLIKLAWEFHRFNPNVSKIYKLLTGCDEPKKKEFVWEFVLYTGLFGFIFAWYLEKEK